MLNFPFRGFPFTSFALMVSLYNTLSLCQSLVTRLQLIALNEIYVVQLKLRNGSKIVFYRDVMALGCLQRGCKIGVGLKPVGLSCILVSISAHYKPHRYPAEVSGWRILCLRNTSPAASLQSKV